MNRTMTATEMLPAVGQHVLLRVEKLQVCATVKDVRYVWGKPQLLVTPMAGQGEQWVELSRLTWATTQKGKLDGAVHSPAQS